MCWSQGLLNTSDSKGLQSLGFFQVLLPRTQVSVSGPWLGQHKTAQQLFGEGGEWAAHELGQTEVD